MGALKLLLSSIVLSIIIFNKSSANINVDKYQQLLYHLVSNGLYDEAVNITKRISADEVKQTVFTMLDNKVKNVINFSFKLWENGGKTMVITVFPKLFKYLFNEDEVHIFSEHANVNIASAGGQSWIFSPVWKNNRVYFKIMNAFPTCYLGFESHGLKPYSCNILREEPTENNYLWLVQPVVYNNKSLNHLLIMNKVYDALLSTNNGDIYGESSCSSQSLLQLLIVDPTYNKCQNSTEILIENISVSGYNHELYEAILLGEYTNATKIIKTLRDNSNEDHITNTIQKVLLVRKNNIITYAAKLWYGGNMKYVELYFPDIFKHILNQDELKIISAKYRLPLKLDNNTDQGDRLAWGDNIGLKETRLMWKLRRDKDNIFRIENVLYSMKIKVEEKEGARKQIWGNSYEAYADREPFYLEAFKYEGNLLFYIISVTYYRGLALDSEDNGGGDRALRAWQGSFDEPPKFGWIFQKI